MASLKTVIAVHTIHRTVEPGKEGNKDKGIKAVPPQVQVILPKTRFIPKDQEELDSLLEAGAIRYPEGDEAKEPKAAEPAKEPKAAAPAKEPEVKTGDKDELV
jgi:hypothetical protein